MVIFKQEMRDLANQSYISGRNNFSRLIKSVVLAFVLVAGIWFFSQRSANPSLTSGPVVLRDAPKGLVPVSLPDDLISAGQAVNLKTGKAVFSNVSDEAEVARATAVRKYGDGTFTLTVEANLPDPKNLKYQVWIVGSGEFFDAGFMNGSGTDWTLIFRDKDYYSKYSQILITREITNNDGKPEKHILEGNF